MAHGGEIDYHEPSKGVFHPGAYPMKKVRVLINPKSGLWWSSTNLQRVLQQHWDIGDIDLSYQYSKSVEDGQAKTRRAIDEGVDTLLVVGGDGMVNSIGSALMGSEVTLGVIPAGSGNGFARHFGIPLHAEQAVAQLKSARRMAIDVGTANGRPFFITCGLAWDAALVRTFDKFPVRGVLPYVFSAAVEYIEYRPKPFQVTIDESETVRIEDPMVFTAANLTQYGGGAQIAPNAKPDDGYLELVVIKRRDLPKLLAHLPKLFSGTLDQASEVMYRRFTSLVVQRGEPGPIQLDGELVQEGSDEVRIEVLPKALNVLVPASTP